MDLGPFPMLGASGGSIFFREICSVRSHGSGTIPHAWGLRRHDIFQRDLLRLKPWIWDHSPCLGPHGGIIFFTKICCVSIHGFWPFGHQIHFLGTTDKEFMINFSLFLKAHNLGDPEICGSMDRFVVSEVMDLGPFPMLGASGGSIFFREICCV